MTEQSRQQAAASSTSSSSAAAAPRVVHMSGAGQPVKITALLQTAATTSSQQTYNKVHRVTV